MHFSRALWRIVDAPAGLVGLKLTRAGSGGGFAARAYGGLIAVCCRYFRPLAFAWDAHGH